MGLLSAGGWAGLGQGMNQIADKSIEQRYTLERDSMLEERNKRLAEHGDKLSRDRAQWDVDTLEPKRSAARVQEAKDTAQAKIDIAYDPANLEKEFAALKGKSQAETEAMIARSSNPEYLRAKRNEALATHIVTPNIELQQREDGTFARYDSRSGKVLGTLEDPATGKPFKGAKGVSPSQAALAKSYFDEGNQLIKSPVPEEQAAGRQAMEMGRKILAGDVSAAPKGEPQGQKPTPNPAAIAALRADPKLRDQFEAKYGVSADQYLTVTEPPQTVPKQAPQGMLSANSPRLREILERRQNAGAERAATLAADEIAKLTEQERLKQEAEQFKNRNQF